MTMLTSATCLRIMDWIETIPEVIQRPKLRISITESLHLDYETLVLIRLPKLPKTEFSIMRISI